MEWQEEQEGWAEQGRRPVSNQGDVLGRWEELKCRWREVDKSAQEERSMTEELEGRRGCRGKHVLQAEEKM